MANITPPFGMNLFIMKGVAPPGTTMGEIYKSIWPFLICNVIGIALIILFPATTTWLPGMIKS
jgi:TRAP-type mannitol/chloroaromatic compound transport system permease large subunit